MPFNTFRNAFRNLIKLENIRNAQINARFTYRTSVHDGAATGIRVARAAVRARPSSSSSSWKSLQVLSRLFTLSSRNKAASFTRFHKSVGAYLCSFRRFSALPMFGAFIFAQQGMTEYDKRPYKPDITDLLELLKKDISKNQKVMSPVTTQPEVSTSLEDYKIKERLGKPSSCAAIYSAIYNDQEFAVKIMFNYEYASNSFALQKGFYKECRAVCKQANQTLPGMDCLPQHPNIIEILNAFDEQTPCPEDALKSYPQALPPRISSDGYGRNRTLCLIMPKYDCTLKEYTKNTRLSQHESLSLLAQLLEGVAHLVDNNEAHRDLKSDNILLRIRENECPHLVITDFGCCIADGKLCMKVPFESIYVDRGGNSAMMAPEIASMKPGPGNVLDYTKSDVWACGALAYEIFGCENPFTNGLLDSRFYQDEDLPNLQSVHPLVTKLVHLLLKRDPATRPSASEAVTLTMLLLFGPNAWLDSNLYGSVNKDDIDTWLLTLCLTTAGEERRFEKQNVPFSAELTLRKCFLRHASSDLVLSALAYLHDMNE